MRIYQIDALRGFALFGILIVNIFVFHAPYAHYGEFYFQFEGFNLSIVENMIFLFAGKFMFVYAFLFGYSFWMQYEKNKTANFQSYWNKRMIVLAGIGILHVLLFSFGDILLPYAILGLCLPFFAKLNNTKILCCFLVIYLIPVYEFVLRGFLDFPSVFMQPVVLLETYIEIYGQGSFFEMFKLRMKDYFSFRNEKLIMYIPKEISLFLLGMLSARIKLANNLPVKKWLIFCIFAILIIIGMHLYRPTIISFFDFENSIVQRILVGLIIHFTEFVHSLLYIVGFFLIWKIQVIQKLLNVLTYTGKLSLTNYIMQSLICVMLFSGFGYYGQFTPMELVICAIAIYLGQISFSIYWLERNQYGPLEYIWRKLSK